MPNHDVRVRRVESETEDIRSIELVAADGGPLPPFEAGAHIDVEIAGLIRQYSLINTTASDGAYRIAVKREPQSRGGSQGMHALEVGAALRISAPRNNFPLAAEATDTVLLAGGIGVTPLLGMAYRLHADGRPFAMDYFVRSQAALAFADDIRRIVPPAQTAFHLGLDAAGVREALASRLSRVQPGTHVYACGPAPFMQLVRDRVAEVPAAMLHLEYFAAEPVASNPTSDAFRVTLSRSGRTVSVAPGETIIDALRAAGVEVETSCEQGVCGTCLTRVLVGRPDHRDMLLTDEERAEGDQMLLCVSRSLDYELVLDL